MSLKIQGGIVNINTYNDNSREYNINANGQDLASVVRAFMAEGDPKTQAEDIEPVPVDNSTILPIPNKGKYTEVRRYIEERKRFDEEFKTYCTNHSLRDLCARLTHEFGWFVDEHSLGSNINRNR